MMINHAFLITAHNQPGLLKNLVSRLSAPNHHFFIHIDRRANLSDFAKELAGISNVVFLEKRYAVNWGSNYQVWATLDLLKKSLEKKCLVITILFLELTFFVLQIRSLMLFLKIM